MEIEDIINKKRKCHSLILKYIENEEEDNNYLEKLTNFIMVSNISKNKLDLQDLLFTILNISNNHRRQSYFFKKIIQIFIFLNPDIQINFSDIEIYNIFKPNKLLVLFLIENKIITPSKELIDLILITKNQHFYLSHCYFLYPFIKPYIDENIQKQIEAEISEKYIIDLNTFQENCQIGENDSYICRKIREDMIDDFIVFINRTNYPLNSIINGSVFETNDFLITNRPTLIEYAAFFGSIQIFKYLQLNNITVNSSIWKYAIHGGNPEIIHFIEEMKIKLTLSYEELMNESIKCHHNSIAHYIEDNYLYDIKNRDYYSYGFIYYNYAFFETNYKILLKLIDKNYESFKSFLSLPKISFPSSETEIVDCNLKELKQLTTVVIHSSVASIGNSAFKGCSSIKQISIPSSITSFGTNIFDGIKSLKITGDIQNFPAKLFEKCSSLTQITIPSSVTSIGNFAFYKCTSLTQIIIPSTLTSIGYYAFAECSSLKQITIPSSVTSIKNSTFKGCSSLTRIIIPSSITSFGNSVFRGCSSLIRITIPSFITSINDYFFYGCSNLARIAIPSLVTSIGNYAFNGCSKLVQITIPPSVTSIGYYSFAECSSLNKITIPSSVSSIENYSFYGCSKLGQITIPPSVTSIGNYAFSYCSSLTQISIPFSVTSIGENTFYKCSKLTQITIPSSVNEDSIGIDSNTKINRN